MARSYRKTPIGGVTKKNSDKSYKTAEHMRTQQEYPHANSNTDVVRHHEQLSFVRSVAKSQRASHAAGQTSSSFLELCPCNMVSQIHGRSLLSDGACGRGASVTNSPHDAPFKANKWIAPSNYGIKHLVSKAHPTVKQKVQ